MLTPIDHARCRELQHPDIVNFSVSVYAASNTSTAHG